ncbi:hypothetical protein Hanom_Chr00s000043g01617501 [Helianthus anomalus]
MKCGNLYSHVGLGPYEPTNEYLGLNIGILVGDGVRIAELITLKWKDKMFKVWVEEEFADWIPDCLEPDESSEEDDEMASQFRCVDLEDDHSLQRVEIKEGSNDGSRFEVHVSPSVQEEGEGPRLHVDNFGNGV